MSVQAYVVCRCNMVLVWGVCVQLCCMVFSVAFSMYDCVIMLYGIWVQASGCV